MLSNRVIRYGIELKRQETEEMDWIVECFKYEKERHKCRKYPKQKKKKKTKKERAVHVAMPQKAQQKE